MSTGQGNLRFVVHADAAFCLLSTYVINSGEEYQTIKKQPHHIHWLVIWTHQLAAIQYWYCSWKRFMTTTYHYSVDFTLSHFSGFIYFIEVPLFCHPGFSTSSPCLILYCWLPYISSYPSFFLALTIGPRMDLKPLKY